MVPDFEMVFTIIVSKIKIIFLFEIVSKTKPFCSPKFNKFYLVVTLEWFFTIFGAEKGARIGTKTQAK